MIYEVRARLYFSELPLAKKTYEILEKAATLSIIVRKNSIHQQNPSVTLIENHHDEDPPKPCVVLAQKDA